MAGNKINDLTQNYILSVGAGFVVALIAYVAQPHLVVVFLAGILVCGAMLIILQLARPHKSRPQLIVKIKGTPQWQGLNDKHRVVAAQVEVTNRTRRAIRIEETDFQYESSGGIFERVHLSGNETAAFDNIAQHYYPQLNGFADVPPRSTISGWYAGSVPRNPFGGTPKCIVTVKDGDENLYQAIIPAHIPQVYSA
jgi:hypothetical protein